ncbi:acyltransferase family protein [Novosphingobium album (ex Hu et al. 2023)]|uniref:Acyltransferase n=1 Tax=Novosphingobium album (ex Hu et al. 2023) TaxID=2930093 RepID=A0ABT0B3D1_9SPHN|nr:acyltransferase [Novosphingobium album (ex Hu et al. 2023)]MCJ2179431.1 acyltransferase [Novosphingobium album (ex Hu et al. 2023)]
MDEARRITNFDYLRLIAAGMVIFTHGLLLAHGDESLDPLARVYAPGVTLGVLGVMMFFAISGYLVARSADTARAPLHFAIKRILRIYPGLFVCLVTTALLIGAPLSLLGVHAFVQHLYPLRYAVLGLLDPAHATTLPTVHLYDDPAGGRGWLMNGVMWTLRYELICYVMIGVLLIARALRGEVITAIFAALVLAGTLRIHDGRLADFFLVVPIFFGGAVIYFASKRIGPVPLWAAALCLPLGYFLYWSPYGALNYYVLVPVMTLALATAPGLQLPSLSRFGDISYGLYLYHWPVQQAIRACAGAPLSAQTMLGISVPIVIAIAWMSWTIVEKPALALRARLRWRQPHPPLGASS